MTAPTYDANAPFGALAAPALIDAACALCGGGGTWLSRYVGRKVAVRYHKNVRRCFDVEADGLRFRVEPHRNIQDRFLFRNRRLPEREWMEVLFAGAPPDPVFLDIGANIGVYSLQAARVLGDRATIVALEPHPGTLMKLRNNLMFNDVSTVRVVAAALGDAPGEATLHEPAPGNEGQNSLHGQGDGVVVAVTSLPALIAELALPRIDLLKIDVEGYEDVALAPLMADDLAAWRPLRILIEHKTGHQWSRDILADLAGLGYVEVSRDGENALLTRDGG